MHKPEASGVVDHAVHLLRMFAIEPRPMDQLVRFYFSRHRELGSGARRAIADAVFGVMRWRSRLDGLLMLGGSRKPTDRERVAVFLERGDALPPDIEPATFPGGVAALQGFPPFLYAHLVTHYGEEGAAGISEALSKPQRPTLRVNALRIGRESALERLRAEGREAEATERSPYGIRLSERVSPDSVELFAQGLADFQDESSQLGALLSSPAAGERVLDACAGAGGKSLMLAMLMRNEGSVVASDVDARKLRILERRARREGVHIIETKPAEELDASLFASFDLVFVDAPCTGTGTLRRSPDIKWRLDDGTIEARAVQQATLLSHYARFVRPGGRLVYATCSLLRRENEDVIGNFLADAVFELIDAGDVFSREGIENRGIVFGKGFLRTDPRVGDWDGFFAALMRRTER